jgi:cellulose synthase/poly-beta-1,6-N-acetylglucosamine synthase-like glycosyltransferase
LHLRNSFKKLKANMAIDWLKKLKEDPKTSSNWDKIFHLVILPMYNEPYEVVLETFQKLTETNYPLDKLIVVLGIEERAGQKAKETAEKISLKFCDKFYKFLVTVHPKDIAGEMPGKGSNESWAAKEVKEKIIDQLKIPYENILVSVFDVDTQVYKDYFGILTYTFLVTDDALHSSFQPVPLFLNNIYKAPALARIVGFSSTFWHLMQQSRAEKLSTFSSHSVPFKPLAEIGFWQKDIVSEDSRIFWQLFLHYNGNWKTVPLFYPVSMDANAAPTFWQTMINLYKQQRRWAWGSENLAYIFDGFRKNKKIPLSKKLYWGFFTLEGYHSWATNSLILFALGWLPIILGGEAFKVTLLAYNLPQTTRLIMFFASFGIVTSAILSMVLLPPKPPNFKKINLLWYLLSWVLMPITLIVFGSIAAIDAQTRLMISGKFRLDFWVTPKHR